MTGRAGGRFVGAAWGLGLVIACAQPAFGQSQEEIARARADFHEALALETAGDWAGALTKLRSVAAVKMTPQVRFNIAVCQEHLGRLVAALGDFRIVRADAEAAGTADVAERAAEHLAQLETRIPKLVVRRAPGTEAAVVSVDGVALGDAALGAPRPVDPGMHRVVARVGDQTWFDASVSLAEGEMREVEVVKAAPQGEPAPSPAPVVAAKPAPREAPPSPPSRAPGWILVGAGGASLAASGVLFALRGGTISDLDAACVDGHCPASAESTADRGRLYTGLAEGTLVAGVAGVAVGTYFLLRPAPARAPAVGVASGAAGSPLGATIVGRF